MELKPTFFPSVPRTFEKIHMLVTSACDACRDVRESTE
jgi:long-subunit acyl-CoA synthetase (AMP-forming)